MDEKFQEFLKEDEREVRKWINDRYGNDLQGSLIDLFFSQDNPYRKSSAWINLRRMISSNSEFFKTAITELMEIKKREDLTHLLKMNKIQKWRDKLQYYRNFEGYNLSTECKTEEEIQQFIQTYYSGENNENESVADYNEELLAFYVDNLKNSRVWFAVKEGAEQLKKEDCTDSNLKQEYGNSVLSFVIPENTDGSKVLIRNRYNQLFENTNLGSWFKEYISNEKLERNEIAIDGVYHKYNHCLNSCYYMPDDTIYYFGEKIKLPEHQKLFDYFIFDFNAKTVSLYDNNIKDAFVETVNPIKDICMENDNTVKIIKENGDEVFVEINKRHEIISISHEKLEQCGNGYMMFNKEMSKLNLPNLKKCGDRFLMQNKSINSDDLVLSSLEECGDEFMRLWDYGYYSNVHMPNLKSCGTYFLENYYGLRLSLPKLENIKPGFLRNSDNIRDLDLPMLQECGESFLSQNIWLEKINMPNLRTCGSSFLRNNIKLKELSLPSLQKCGEYFVDENEELKEVNLPMLQECGESILSGLPKFAKKVKSKAPINVAKSLVVKVVDKIKKVFVKENNNETDLGVSD